MDIRTLRLAAADIYGTGFISLDTRTSVHLFGGNSNPYQGQIWKHTKGIQAMCFSNPAFERLVRRKLLEDGITVEFKVGPRPWGTRVEGMPLVEHNDKLYLEVFVLKPGEASFIWKNKIVDPTTIQGLVTKKESDLGVDIRVYNSDSILSINVNKNRYT